MMRIITGRARGVRLTAPKGETTRPTSERTKEAVFSMLQFDLCGAHVLDLFAGSGQMGLEALSRGAADALLCDASKDAVAVIRSNAEKTRLSEQCRIHHTDALALLRSLNGKSRFDMVFLDPPYAKGLLPKALELLVEYNLLENGARIVCESADPEDVFGGNDDLEASFELLKQSHYGIAYVTVLRFAGCGKGETK